MSAGMIEERVTSARRQATGPATNYDEAVRYLVPSRSNPRDTYLVQLDAFRGNGLCQCKWFVCNVQPWLKLGYDGPRALAEGKVKLIYEGQRPEDALRCFHIIDGQRTFADDVLKEIAKRRLGRDQEAEGY